MFVLSTYLLSVAQVSENGADTIIGFWLMPEKQGIIEIFKDGDYYHGKILWMLEKEEDGTPLKDKENPVDTLRSRTVEGLQVMSGFKYQGDNIWSGGTFYAAKKGMEVEPDFVIEDEDHLNIKISIFIFSKTLELSRVDTSRFYQEMKEPNN